MRPLFRALLSLALALAPLLRPRALYPPPRTANAPAISAMALPTWAAHLQRLMSGKGGVFRFIVLATVEDTRPRARTVVFRDWHTQDGSFYVVTDTRHGKVRSRAEAGGRGERREGERWEEEEEEQQT